MHSVRKYIVMGVMLSLSKHGGAGLSAHTLRQAQGDNAQKTGVMLRHSKHGVMGIFVFTVLFCLFLSVTVLAQSGNSTHKDTSVKYPVRETGSLSKSTKPLIVLDGIPFTGDFKDINPDHILNVNVLKDNNATAIYGSQADKGVVIITTKQYAIKQYQQKLSSFSKDYRAYLLEHQGKDDVFEYEINGTALEDNYYGNAQKLYKIPIENIKRVDFLKNPTHNGFSGKTNIVNILTKN